MTLADDRRWMAQGTALFLATTAALTEDECAAPSGLPDWSRKHVLAHVAANADALGNLVHWAATGEPTPMYPSQEARDADIERGAALPTAELLGWLRSSAEALETAMDALTPEQWKAEVRTRQGRALPAADVPWMRAREAYIHTIDLAAGVGFADLPEDVVERLCEELRVQRGVAELPAGPAPEVAAWLTGRPHSLADAPELGPWL